MIRGEPVEYDRANRTARIAKTGKMVEVDTVVVNNGPKSWEVWSAGGVRHRVVAFVTSERPGGLRQSLQPVAK